MRKVLIILMMIMETKIVEWGMCQMKMSNCGASYGV